MAKRVHQPNPRFDGLMAIGRIPSARVVLASAGLSKDERRVGSVLLRFMSISWLSLSGAPRAGMCGGIAWCGVEMPAAAIAGFGDGKHASWRASNSAQMSSQFLLRVVALMISPRFPTQGIQQPKMERRLHFEILGQRCFTVSERNS